MFSAGKHDGGAPGAGTLDGAGRVIERKIAEKVKNYEKDFVKNS